MWLLMRMSLLAFILDVSMCARILCVYNVPSISHQMVYRELTKELAKRGHDLVVITPDPYLPKNRPPDNVREIDVSESYKVFAKEMAPIVSSDEFHVKEFHNIVLKSCHVSFDFQLENSEVKELIRNKSERFDLLIVEGITRGPFFFTHRFKAPVIAFASLMAVQYNYEAVGAPVDPFLYPTLFQSNSKNVWLNMMKSVLTEWYERYAYWRSAELENSIGRKHFGQETPDIQELIKNVDLIFTNINPVWDGIRPVPPSVIYLGGLHLKEPKPLSKELQVYLDGCKQGAIYFSFGTNVRAVDVPLEKIKLFKKVFSQLPYCVMWKWELEEMEGKPQNVRIAKWWPQSDILNHTNVKLFITQGGLQSTEETIQREVPAIGIPFIADQEKNVLKLDYHGIGKYFHLEDVTEDNFKDTILDVIKNERYRKNIRRLKTIYNDQPSSPLERAVWWVEYLLRHGGARHLHAPPIPPTFAGYSYTALIAIAVAAVSIFMHVISLVRCYLKSASNAEKLKKP